ncbi:hypothetical protein [Faecalibacillus intestinalis]|uniref:hypothetical protein n=1 Tax=Faecalibacillus intestinalis TaxID=1982626 RepID=UPI003AB6670B
MYDFMIGKYFNYFYLFWIFVYAGSATVFARSLGDISTFGNAFAICLTIFAISLNKIKFNTKFIYSLVIFCIYALATTLNNQTINLLWWSQWLIRLAIAYVIIRIFKEGLLYAFEKMLVFFCYCSLSFWILYLVAPNMLLNFASFVHFSEPYGADNSNVAYNLLVYTIGSNSVLNQGYWVVRNAGFAWEPGAFSSIIIIGIFCNILRKGFILSNNKHLILFLITLFTTQSTTGIGILLACSVFWAFVNGRKGWAIIWLIAAIFLFMVLPFMQEKILGEYVIMNEQVRNVENVYSHAAYGRMSSFVLSWQEFLRHPILGLGGYAGGTYLMQRGIDNVALISGIGHLLSMYGAVMSFLFFKLLYKSGKSFSHVFETKNGYMIIVVMLGIMISYNLWMNPLLMSFWLFNYYSGPLIPQGQMKGKRCIIH